MVIKTYLSKHGFVLKKEFFDTEEIQNIKNILTARPLTSGEFFSADNSYTVFIETKNKLYIPKMFGLSKFGKPDGVLPSYLGKPWSENIKFQGTLFDTQIEPSELLYNACINYGGGILSLGTGLGKTITCLNVLSRLKGKTIIVVNKISLLKQWENEIKQFLPNASIGILQGQKNINIDNKDIILAMLQSLSRIDYPDNFFNEINTTVIDESHNLSSQHFSKIFFKLTSQYNIGLTATPQRSDGCEMVFKWHLGDIVYQSQTRIMSGLTPTIINLKIQSTDYTEITKLNKFTGKSQIQFTSMLTHLINMNKRNILIKDLILKYVSENRKILVLSERRNHVVLLKKLLDELKPSFSYGVFLGSMKIKDLEASKTCQVILATIAAFGEGVSEKNLDTLILTTPKKFIQDSGDQNKKKDGGKLNQIVGRILRKIHTERPPLIIDLQDDFSVYKYQTIGRKKFYQTYFNKCTYINQYVNLDNYENITNVITNTTNSKKIENQKCLID